MALKVVELHDGRPPLTDISGRLRLLADQIEAGEYGEVNSLLCLIPQDFDYPIMLGFGNIEGRNDPIVQLEMAKVNFVINVMTRK